MTAPGTEGSSAEGSSAEGSSAGGSSLSRPPRRTRSVTESLLSIVLGLEAILVFFVMLTAFGLKALPAAAAFGGGLALILALMLVSGLLRYPWAIWLGWVLQAALVATGIFLPIMYFIAAGFVAIWVYCFIKARQIEHDKAQFIQQQEETP